MKLYNSLTFKEEEFKPISTNKISMYVCGPTVYDSAHLGHAKSAVVFDVIRRYLEFKGYDVFIIKNYTDIDDKIIKRANELNISYKELSEKYIQEYQEVMKLLNVKKENENPKATDTIPYMIKLIEGLLEKGNAYERNGSVYFSVKSFPKYSTIFQNVSKEQDEQADYYSDQDTAYGEEKDDTRDFALWKKMKEGEPYWESPWGKGRPGWHIECSAMVLNLLGDTIDIHGGGQDLKFPHHRNEIAQSESFTGKPFANYFLHNGFVNVDDEKMSKSLGNFFLVSDVVKKFDPMVVRLFLISSHYRSSINYTLDNMQQIEKNYNRLLKSIKTIQNVPVVNSSKEEANLIELVDTTMNEIVDAMDNDFNTPVAIASILLLLRNLNREIIERKSPITERFKQKFFQFIEMVDSIFGIFPNLKKDLTEGFAESTDERDVLNKKLVSLILEVRESLRKKKLYEFSDKIRESLQELGIDVEDK